MASMDLISAVIMQPLWSSHREYSSAVGPLVAANKRLPIIGASSEIWSTSKLHCTMDRIYQNYGSHPIPQTGNISNLIGHRPNQPAGCKQPPLSPQRGVLITPRPQMRFNVQLHSPSCGARKEKLIILYPYHIEHFDLDGTGANDEGHWDREGCCLRNTCDRGLDCFVAHLSTRCLLPTYPIPLPITIGMLEILPHLVESSLFGLV